jgi:hypothetical protein
MLTEDSVIDAVSSMLKEHGYETQQITKGRKPGDDIIAIKQGNPTRQLFIEAKGETSGAKNSKNYDKPFVSADIRVNTAEALYKAAVVLSRKIEGNNIFAGIALPNHRGYRAAIKKVEPIIARLGIIIFWVNKEGDVEVVGASKL